MAIYMAGGLSSRGGINRAAIILNVPWNNAESGTMGEEEDEPCGILRQPQCRSHVCGFPELPGGGKKY